VGEDNGYAPFGWEDAPPLPSLEGKWAMNNALEGAEQLSYSGSVLAPESFAVWKDSVYASIATGAVVRLPSDTSQAATPIFFAAAAAERWSGAPGEHPLYARCVELVSKGNVTSEDICGRPLGLRVFNDSLYIADAVFGIFKVALGDAVFAMPTPEWLVKPTDVSPAMRFINDLVVDERDGSVYFTDSSSVNARRSYLTEIKNNAAVGRLLRKAPDAQVEVLASSLHFPNGVELVNGTVLLVVELGRMRILRCDLPVPSGGECALSPFTSAPLPCVADNLRLSADGGELLLGCATKIAQPASLIYIFWTQPNVGRLVNTVLSAVPSVQERVRSLVQSYGLVLRINLDGNPKGSWHDPSGRTASISQATQAGGFLWLGSPVNPYVARVPMAKLGAGVSGSRRRRW
jgi:hypothetical protein